MEAQVCWREVWLEGIDLIYFMKTVARVFVRVVSDAGGAGVVVRWGVVMPASEPPAEDGDGPFAGRDWGPIGRDGPEPMRGMFFAASRQPPFRCFQQRPTCPEARNRATAPVGEGGAISF